MKASRHPVDRSPMSQVTALDHGRVRKGAIACRLQEDVFVSPSRLGNYCFSDVSERIEDLIVMTGIVAFADRAVVRNTSNVWHRHISLSIPVLDIAFWQQPVIGNFLSELLNDLTGDFWVLDFKKKMLRLPSHPQPPLALQSGVRPIVVPYSDGMDSFMGVKLQEAKDPRRPVLQITLGQKRDPAPVDRSDRKQRYRFAVPFTLKGRPRTGHRLREPSFRSRALIYSIHAGLAAHLSGADEVIVPESGQGALGPWLVPVGNEAHDIRMHPMFTKKVSQLLNLVVGADVHFEHPHIWNTKAETLLELIAIGGESGWERTRSCAQDARTASAFHRLVQCGVCAACLLRRQTVHAAGLHESDGTYLFTSSLEKGSAGAPANVSTRRQALSGILQLDDLARLGSPSDNEVVVLRRKAKQLADAMGMTHEDVKSKLMRMLKQHREEWLGFSASLGGSACFPYWSKGEV
jgi:hypothetical protein